MHGNAGRVNLYVAGVGKSGTLTVTHPSGTAVAVHRIGREVIKIAVTTGGQHYGMSCIAFQVASDQVADNDAACPSVLDDQIHHLASFVEFDRSTVDLAA